MDGRPQDRRLREELAAALLASPGVDVAFLFGSTARGTAHHGSDVDVAVLPSVVGLSLPEESNLVAALERRAHRRIDLVRLDDASPALAWRVARDGVLLMERRPGAAARWRARVAIEHAEFEPTFRAGLERFRAALARGASTTGTRR